VAAKICLDEPEDEGQGVPNGHDFAEQVGKEAEDLCLRGFFQLLDDRVDEGGYGELGADHEADREDRDDVEYVHVINSSRLLIRIRYMLMQMDVLTNLSVPKNGTYACFQERDFAMSD
jgi:hypothetical protein